MSSVQTATTGFGGGVKVGDIVSMPETVYSRRERFLVWLLNRGWRGRLVKLLFCGWYYRPKGHQIRREYRITESFPDDATVTVEPA